jgi:hypothetical protein
MPEASKRRRMTTAEALARSEASLDRLIETGLRDALDMFHRHGATPEKLAEIERYQRSVDQAWKASVLADERRWRESGDILMPSIALH